MRGCYYNGSEHSRENCKELREALEHGDVHKKGPVLFLGYEDTGSNIKVLISRENGNGKIVWYREWVMNELMKKESQVLANSITLESCGVNTGCKSKVVSGASGVSKGKRKANFRDF